MINSTGRCDARSAMGLLAQRLIIRKHTLSLHVPEAHQLERGLCLGQSQRGFHIQG